MTLAVRSPREEPTDLLRRVAKRVVHQVAVPRRRRRLSVTQEGPDHREQPAVAPVGVERPQPSANVAFPSAAFPVPQLFLILHSLQRTSDHSRNRLACRLLTVCAGLVAQIHSIAPDRLLRGVFRTLIDGVEMGNELGR